LLNLRAKILPLLSLTSFELRKMFRRKVAHAGILVSLFLTALGALGVSLGMRRHPIHPDRGMRRLGINVWEFMNGIAFSEMILFPGIYMILPMIIGVFTAVVFAGEYQNGYIRAVAIRPVERWQIFMGKFLSITIYSFILLAILLLVSYSVGAIMFGASGDVIIMGNKLFGQGPKFYILNANVAAQRLILSYLFAGYSLVSLSAMFLMFSAIFKKPAIATVFPLGIYYTSYILDALPFMESLQRFLPTRYLMVWKYVLAENIQWDKMMYDGGYLMAYTVSYLVIGGVVFAKSEL